MFKFLFKPTIKAKLLNGGKEASITLKNINSRETFLLLYLAMSDISKRLGMEPRALMNRVIDLDKQIIKTEKLSKKEEYRQKHLSK